MDSIYKKLQLAEQRNLYLRNQILNPEEGFGADIETALCEIAQNQADIEEALVELAEILGGDGNG